MHALGRDRELGNSAVGDTAGRDSGSMAVFPQENPELLKQLPRMAAAANFCQASAA